MEGVLYDACLSFSCIAGECPSNCCQYWTIVVDEESYHRFQQIENESLREDILSNIVKGQQGYHFAHGRDGRCRMLDGHGLCRIQSETSEEMLCETCRKFPRLSGCVGEGRLWLSMAASCPVIARRICEQKPLFFAYDADNQMQKVSYEKLLGPKSVKLADYGWIGRAAAKKGDYAKKHAGRYPEWFLLYRCMLVIVDGCVDLMLQFAGCPYLSGSFDYFEQDTDLETVRESLLGYQQDVAEEWERLSGNYWEYRQFTCCLEYPQIAEDERIMQVVGELALLYTISFSRHMLGKEIAQRGWEEMVCFVYRFCAHGLEMTGRLRQYFVEHEGEILAGMGVICNRHPVMIDK